MGMAVVILWLLRVLNLLPKFVRIPRRRTGAVSPSNAASPKSHAGLKEEKESGLRVEATGYIGTL